MNPVLEILNNKNIQLTYIELLRSAEKSSIEDTVLYKEGERSQSLLQQVSVVFEKKEVGYLQYQTNKNLNFEESQELSKKLAPLFLGNFSTQIKTFKWVCELKKELLDQNASWVGIYWKESFIIPNKEKSTDLILGPFIGFVTPHIRIGIQKGLCGRAIRENQTLNIADVSQSPEYLSCSIETKSEVVIPLRDSNGMPIGELDIDSKVLSGFNSELIKKLENSCLLFEKTI